jgi:AcrR family transcriptional regulator
MKSSQKDMTNRTEDSTFQNDVILTSTKNVILAERRHQQIVEGACKVFYKKGYHPTTTRDIAKACNMSIGQLYHYISCKDDVLYLVHKHMGKVWLEYLNKPDLEQIIDPVEKLKEALRRSSEFMAQNKKLIQFVYSESKYLNKKHLKTVLEMDYQNVVSFWGNLVKDIKKTKAIKCDPDYMGSIITYLNAFLPLRGWTLNVKQKEKHTDSMVDFILRGLGVL